MTVSETTVTLEKKKKRSGPIDLSVGSGIAIVGVWFVGAAVTLTLFFSVFVFTDWTSLPKEMDFWTGLNVLTVLVVVVWLTALPMIAAFSITKKILGKKD
jgi:hypothetical protein